MEAQAYPFRPAFGINLTGHKSLTNPRNIVTPASATADAVVIIAAEKRETC